MKLTEAERDVLGFLVDHFDHDFGFYSFDGIRGDVNRDRKEIRRACRSLKRKGLTEFKAGLWTDCGEPAGSGYAATDAGIAALEEE